MREEKELLLQFMEPSAKTIIDLGCGIGTLSKIIAKKKTGLTVVGLDYSRALLKEAISGMTNFFVVRGEASQPPFIANSFDCAVASRVLHEVQHFRDKDALQKLLRNTWIILKDSGQLLLFDHLDPGDAVVNMVLPAPLLNKLRDFQKKFKVRPITFEAHGHSVEIKARDLHDFLTKIWSLDTEMQEEEMSETHAPWRKKTIMSMLRSIGFSIVRTSASGRIADVLDYYGIRSEHVNWPRYLILDARKLVK